MAQIAVFVLLLGLSAFFSSCETGFFSLDRLQREQLRRDKHPRIGLIERLLSKPRRLIVTILIGNEFANIAATVVSAAVVIELWGADNKLFNLLFMVPVLLLVGEITPKTMAMRNNVAFASAQARPIDLFARLITPIRWLVHKIADFIATAIVGREWVKAPAVTEDLVRSLAQEAVDDGVLDHAEARYIDQILDFGNKTVEEVMTPRSKLLFFQPSQPIDEVIAELQRTRHTKVPVFREGSRDNVLGILHARDLLAIDLAAFRNKKNWMRTILRSPFLVPSSKPAVALFHAFRRRRISIALVVDEYGGLTGLVTMEDLLECIVGDIRSPSDFAGEGSVESLGGGHTRIAAALGVERFNAVFDATLPVDVADTIGGLLLHEHGELPTKGVAVELDGFTLTVLSMIDNRIDAILVTRPRPNSKRTRPSPSDDDADPQIEVHAERGEEEP